MFHHWRISLQEPKEHRFGATKRWRQTLSNEWAKKMNTINPSNSSLRDFSRERKEEKKPTKCLEEKELTGWFWWPPVVLFCGLRHGSLDRSYPCRWLRGSRSGKLRDRASPTNKRNEKKKINIITNQNADTTDNPTAVNGLNNRIAAHQQSQTLYYI